ncbi:MAG: hypothetical protein ACYDES_01455 [Acidimicrobiales bacterium]
MQDSLVEVALSCCPSWWRDRYADEVRSLSDELRSDGRPASRISFDLVRGALRLRASAEGMPRVLDLWTTRAQLSIAVATIPWLLVAPLVLFATGTLGLHSAAGRVFPSQMTLIGSNSLEVMGRHGPVAAPPLTPAGWMVVNSSRALLVLFVGTLLVLVVPLNGDPTAAHALIQTFWFVAVGGWLASIVCVSVAARRAEVSRSDLRFGRTVSVIVAVLFSMLLAAYLTWGIGVIVQARQAAHGTFTTVVTSNEDLWMPMVLVLLFVVALTALAARAAVRSWRVISVEIIR